MTDRLAALLPYPRSVRPQPGRFQLSADIPIAVGPGARQAAAAVRRVIAALPWPDQPPPAESRTAEPPPAEHPPAEPPSAGRLTAVARSGPGPEAGEMTVDVDGSLPAEGYQLRIGPGRVRIVAGGEAGAFYAAQTVRQLLPDQAWRAAPVPGPPWQLPCAEIDDAPALAWRGGHLDVARHFFPKSVLLRFIDLLAAHKLNRFHLHLTDDQGWRVESLRYPALQEIGSHRPRTRAGHGSDDPARYDDIPHGGYYTLADLAEIRAYAAARMVTLIPEVEVPGHASALLAALPQLGSVPDQAYQVLPDWGIFPNIISPLPGTLGFLGEIFGELLGAVPAPYVHIGGDECVLRSWRDNPAIRDYRGALRPDTVVMAWRGAGIARRAAEAGHDVIAVPVVPTYFDYAQADDEREPLAIGGSVTLQDVAAFGPAALAASWPGEAARRLAGTQFQLWTEYIPDGRALDYMAFPRDCMLADVAWSGGPAPGRPGWRRRLATHLGRLDAAGVGYRPLDGPRPWQQGGTGARGHRGGYRTADITAHLDDLARQPDGPAVP